jgi:hypothetical protein
LIFLQLLNFIRITKHFFKLCVVPTTLDLERQDY